MRKRTAIFLFLPFLFVLNSIPPIMSASPSTLVVTTPKCSLSGDIPLPENTAYAQVNVTATYPIANALFYYEFVALNYTGPPPVLASLGQYNHSATGVPTTNGTFTLSFPISNPENNTVAFGFVRLNDTQGDVAYSNGQPYPLPTCTFSSAAPEATLDMEVSVLDINPRYLNMSVNVFASVHNSITFAPVYLLNIYTTPSSLPVNQSESNGYYLYSSARTNETILPYGVGELFPFDSYTYYMEFQAQETLNFSSMSLNDIQLQPNHVTPNVLNYSTTASINQRIDQSSWILNASALFTAGKGNQLPYLTIFIHITRSPSQVEYAILIPLVALYGMLSVSLLATRKNDLANRLLIYISIFIFSYGFLSYASGLVPFPLVAGQNMLELITLALIPCTALLAALSFVRWMPGIRKNAIAANVADLLGIALALITLLIVTTFSVRQYEPVLGVIRLVPVQYSLRSLGWFGDALLLLFGSGLIYPAAKIALGRHRLKERQEGRAEGDSSQLSKAEKMKGPDDPEA